MKCNLGNKIFWQVSIRLILYFVVPVFIWVNNKMVFTIVTGFSQFGLKFCLNSRIRKRALKLLMHNTRTILEKGMHLHE